MAMVGALLAARREVPIVAGITTRDDGSVREIAPAVRAAAGRSGLALLPVDQDGRVRRFDERLGVDDRSVPTLVGELARVLDLRVEHGLIQYALGSGYDYVPLRQVLDWAAQRRSVGPRARVRRPHRADRRRAALRGSLRATGPAGALGSDAGCRPASSCMRRRCVRSKPARSCSRPGRRCRRCCLRSRPRCGSCRCGTGACWHSRPSRCCPSSSARFCSGTAPICSSG